MIAGALFASFLAPALYSAAILALTAAFFLNRGLIGGPQLPKGTGSLMSAWAIFAALAILGPTLSYGHSGQNIDAFKFVFAGAAFLFGIGLGVGGGGIKTYLPIYLAVMTVFYAAQYFIGDVLGQDSLLYPPDNNHSAAMFAVFLPVIVLRSEGKVRILLLFLTGLFAFFVASRALLALTIISFAFSPKALRKHRAIFLIAAPLALAVLLWRGFNLDTFSDQLRLQILQVSFNYGITRGANAFNFGEAAFTDFLNIYPVYRRLEIQHAHNILLQIWNAYGIVPLIAFCVFIIGLGIRAVRSSNLLLMVQLFVFFAFGMIEALITDVRAFGTLMFALGYAYSRGQFLAEVIPGNDEKDVAQSPHPSCSRV